MTQVRYIVRGRVQGVGFRYFTQAKARSLGIQGYVRNLSDGSVEVVAEGTDTQQKLFAAELREGPSFARVDKMLESVSEFPEAEFTGFVIR